MRIRYNSGMRQDIHLWVVGVAAVILTVVVAVLPVPEDVMATSADGVLTVMGKTRASQRVAIEPMSASLPIVSAYRVEPSGITLDVPMLLTFDAQGTGVTAERVGVYQYDDATSMWKHVATSTDGDITIAASMLGTFGIGLVRTVDAPVFLTTYDDLKSRAPVNTQGYEISVGYSIDDGETIFLDGAGERGGCGGIVGEGENEERSMTTKQAMTLVDDVQTQVTYSFVARWFVGDEPCAILQNN